MVELILFAEFQVDNRKHDINLADIWFKIARLLSYAYHFHFLHFKISCILRIPEFYIHIGITGYEKFQMHKKGQKKYLCQQFSSKMDVTLLLRD